MTITPGYGLIYLQETSVETERVSSAGLHLPGKDKWFKHTVTHVGEGCSVKVGDVLVLNPDKVMHPPKINGEKYVVVDEFTPNSILGRIA